MRRKGKIKPDCSKCGEKLDRKGRYCKKCHNAYNNEWRKNNPPSEEQRIRGIIRKKTNMRIHRGLLIQYPCEVCGHYKVEAHHDDYEKPYCVRWLCREHHNEFHRLQREKMKLEKQEKGG